MITIPTVLVFGAGVSCSFGYPSGIELRNNIINNLDLNSGCYNEIREFGFDDVDITAFRSAFRDSGKESVDAFLEHRVDFLEIGKAAIAQELLKWESAGILSINKQGENLYFYLFKHLNASPEEFSQNKLAIVTFNYDRSFEQFLFSALKNSYGLTDERTAEMLKHLPVIHVHGHLGLFPWQGVGGRKYGGADAGFQVESLRRASKGIKIIHEKFDTAEEDPEFRRAHDYIRQAQRLIFLGFGYDKTNLRRLRVPTESTVTQIFGSCLGLTEQEQSDLNVASFHSRAILGRTHFDALNFLRNYLSLMSLR